MHEDHYEFLKDVNDPDLIETLAFKLTDYRDDAQAALWTVASERRITRSSITDLRRERFADFDKNMNCVGCNEAIVLDNPEFISGRYHCPTCGLSFLIPYQALRTIRQKPITPPRELTAPPDDELRGIGGWLIVVAIGLCLTGLSYLKQAILLTGNPEMVLDALVSWLYFGYIAIVLYHLFTKSRHFRELFIAGLIANLVLALEFVIHVGITPESLKFVSRAAIYALIWIPYTKLSQRVQNTFHAPPQEPPAGPPQHPSSQPPAPQP